jgi:hypothetical protein
MSGTLLSDLDSSGSANLNDDTAVQRILSEMNSGGTQPQHVQLQAPQVQSRQPPAMNSPNPNSTSHHSMDSQPPTAHIIGADHPTSGDFAQMMYGSRNQQQYVPQNPYAQPMMQQPMYMPPTNKKNWYSDILTEAKTPVLVSIIFFFLSLPFVSILISHYVPSFVKGTGELTTLGLVLKSLLAGSVFWVLHRIIAPLLISS